MSNSTKLIYKEFKTALNKLKFPDSWFWARYTLNPYSGCAHACIYCDARSQRYYLDQNFETEVIVKVNIDTILDKKIRRSRTLKPDVVAAGGVNDAYQPAELKEENTLKILKILRFHNFPVNIATKSNLITRDIELLDDIGKRSWCTVGFSITTTNEELASFLEPFSSSPVERFKALKELKKKASNIQVGTYFMPIIPFLEDDEENMENVIKESKNAGADFVLFSPGLTLRDSQAEFFINKLKKSKYKDIVKPLLNLFNGKIYPPSHYSRKYHPILYELCKKFNLSVRVKRWIPKDFRKWNYKISELLLNKEYVESITKGINNNKLKLAGRHLNNLPESIIEVYRRGELSRLNSFTPEIIDIVEDYIGKHKIQNQPSGLDRFI